MSVKAKQLAALERGLTVVARMVSALGLMLGGSVFAQDSLPQLDLDLPLRLDFSGAWEKDFRRSDNWEDELSRTLRIRQESAARQQASPGSTRIRSIPPISVGNVNLPRSRGRGANIVDLARLAEYISRQSTINIVQTRDEIRIERSGEAALICGVEYDLQRTFSSEHGVEVCGWDGQQLVFQIMLPDDLIIMHRFTVSSNQQVLNLLTSIYSKGGEPFNLIQAFNKYQAAPDEFNCIQTLSRGQVCNQSGADISPVRDRR
ncbi:MAG: hypothetical protein DHS20C12_23640 [Pseudohongiella sp.]|nr:MAG: hypothetical protein DHS20C12_23640 [Pseudohongiella sp.]